jgi:divalent metal cation (Fe/Co/Zn/Cd) transporter
MTDQESRLYRTALTLSLFTIFYNILEGVICIFLGIKDETLTLFGFGVDSLVEVVSGFGILQMVLRIRRNPGQEVSAVEVRALRITGIGFLILAAGLAAGIIVNLVEHHKPESTFWGTIISVISILVMIWLVVAKRKVGRQLKSAAILSDAICSQVCIYMSLVLLFSSALYWITGFAYADILGSAGLIWFSVAEGREALKKAKYRNYSVDCCAEDSE